MARQKVLPDTAPPTLYQRLKDGGAKAVIGTRCHMNIADYHHTIGDVVTLEVLIDDVELKPKGRCGGPEFIVRPISGQGQFSVPVSHLRMTHEEFVIEAHAASIKADWYTVLNRMNNAKSVYQERKYLAEFIEQYVPDGFKNVEIAAEIADLGGNFDKVSKFQLGRIKSIAKRLGTPPEVLALPPDEDDEDDYFRGCC